MQQYAALGHPARIRVLELLAERDRAVHELRAAIEVEASNLSQQLGVLRLAGLVTQRREHGEVIYSLALAEVRDLLLKRLHTLKPDYRQVILLRLQSELEWQEIATRMDCPIGTVRSRIFRAREAIDVELRPLMDTGSAPGRAAR